MRAHSHTIREGLVIYRRPRTAVWQCRYRLPDGTWHRLSTGCRDTDAAAERAITLAQQGALRHEIGLPSKRASFGTVAREAQADIQRIRSQGSGKVVYRDYEEVPLNLSDYLVINSFKSPPRPWITFFIDGFFNEHNIELHQNIVGKVLFANFIG